MNLKPISEYLSKNKLWDIPMREFTSESMTEFCKIAAGVGEEYKPPYLRELKRNGKPEYDLVIPSVCHPKYRHWQGGQSAKATCIELGADRQTIEKYSHREGAKH